MAQRQSGRKPTNKAKMRKAIEDGDTGTIQQMVQQNSIDVNANISQAYFVKYGKRGLVYRNFTPLHYAVKLNKLECVKLLTQLGASVTTIDYDRDDVTKTWNSKTPLDRAVDKECSSIVFYLAKAYKEHISTLDQAYQQKICIMVQEYEAKASRGANLFTSSQLANADVNAPTIGMGALNRSSSMQRTSTITSGVATGTNGHDVCGSHSTTAKANSLATETSGPNVSTRSQVTICKFDAPVTATSPGISDHESLLTQDAQMFELLEIVAPRVMAEWDSLAYCMKYRPEEVEAFKKNASSDLKECCKNLFLNWLTTGHDPKPKTYQTLLRHIKKINNLTAASEAIERELIEALR